MYPNVRAELARKNLTLTMVSEKLNISLSTLSTQLKKGTITLKMARQIKELLETEMSLEELFTEAS